MQKKRTKKHRVSDLRYWKNWKRITVILSIIVIVGTTGALMLPAITLATSKCELTEHQHTSACYTANQNKILSCSKESLAIHSHGDACYDTEGRCICGQADILLHTHDKMCYDAQNQLVCQLPELVEHQHGDACYQMLETEPEEGHVHTDECYTWTRGALICGQTESEGHAHKTACYGEKELICTEAETAAHDHAESCYGEKKLICTKEEKISHTHGSDCYGEKELICTETEIEAHTHTDSCYNGEELVCGLEITEGHSHSDACYGSEVLLCKLEELVQGHNHNKKCYGEAELICGLEVSQGHTHADVCYGAEALLCGLEVSEGHQHSDVCYEKLQGDLICTEQVQSSQGSEKQLICELALLSPHTHGESCYTTESENETPHLICGQMALGVHAHTENCLTEGEAILSCGFEEHVHTEACGEKSDLTLMEDVKEETVTSTVSSTPEGATFQMTSVDILSEEYTENQTNIANYLTQSYDKIKIHGIYQVDLSFVDENNNKVTAEDGSYTVTLDFGTEPILAGDGAIQVLHIKEGTNAEETTVENLPAHVTRDDSGVHKIEFTTGSFSDFAIVNTSTTGSIIKSGELDNADKSSKLYWELSEHDNGDRTLLISGVGSLPMCNETVKDGIYDANHMSFLPWFTYRFDKDTKIVFGEGITHTGRYTFKNWKISDIVFSSTVETIGEMAFGYVQSLKEVTIPSNVKVLEKNAFIYSHLIHFHLNEGLEIIGDSSLGGGNNQSSAATICKIPSTVTKIGENPCWTASAYEVAEANPYYQSIDGVLFSKDGSKLVAYPRRATKAEYTVPAGVTVQSGALKSISAKTKKLIVSERVTLEGSQYFRDSGVQEIYISDGVIWKGGTGYMFTNCGSLQSLRLPEDTAYSMSGNMLNANFQLHKLTIPKNVTKLEGGLLQGNESSLTEVLYDANNASIAVDALKDPDNMAAFNLTIGKNVSKLPKEFAQFVDKAANIYFDGDETLGNTLYVEEGVFENAPEPLKGLSGWIHITAVEETIYLLDPETHTAQLYATTPIAGGVFQIPVSITPERASNEAIDGKAFTITGIHAHAFEMAKATEEIVFEDASNITNIDSYAFANTMTLKKISDRATNTTAETTDTADALFTNATKLGYGRYNNTGLGDAPSFGPGFAEQMSGVQALHAEVPDPSKPNNTLTKLDVLIEGGGTTVWKVCRDSGLGGYSSLTGEQVKIKLNVDNSFSVNNTAKYRVYLTRTNPNCKMDLSLGANIIKVDDKGTEITVNCSQGEDENTFILEFPNILSATAEIPVTVYYPSPKSYGGGLRVRAEIEVIDPVVGANQKMYPATGTITLNGATVDSEYIDATWGTEPLIFELAKENINPRTSNEQKTVSIVNVGGEEAINRFSDALKYQISMTSKERVSALALGKDYVKYVEFIDELTLPEGVTWDPIVWDALEAKNGRFLSISKGVISCDGEALVTIGEPAKPLTLTDVSLQAVKDGDKEKILICWSIRNNGTSDLSNLEFPLTIHPAALRIQVSDTGASGSLKPGAGTITLTNTVRAKVHYTYADTSTMEDQAQKTIAGGDGKLLVSKTGSKVSYFGEDQTYTVRAYNNGGLKWSSETENVHYLWDKMSSSSYITTDNMDKMFKEAAAAGTPLTILIENAEVHRNYDRKFASGVYAVSTEARAVADDELMDLSGNSGDFVLIHTGNSDIVGQETADLLITYDSTIGKYTVCATFDKDNQTIEHKGQEVGVLLHMFAYGATVKDQYTCAWKLNDAGSHFELEAGRDVRHNIYSTIKSTFQISGSDWPNHYPVDNPISVQNQTARVSAVAEDGKSTLLAASGSVSSSVRREAIIGMGLTYTDKEGNVIDCRKTGTMPSGILNGQVMDYTLHFTHYGKGAYDDLPLVNDLSGDQYLLVRKDLNIGLQSLNLETKEIEGVSYYILKNGSYRDVVVGELDGVHLIASSITVQDAAEGSGYSGIHTQIKWYFERLEGGDYTLDIAFKSIMDFGEEASYTIGNKVWVSDRSAYAADDRVANRIYDALWGGGVILTYNKEIVEKTEAGKPSEDVIFESYDKEEDTTIPYPVSEGQEVTYRLTLDSSGNGKGTYHGSSFADLLPDTYQTFAWTKENVTIDKVEVDGDVEGEEDLTTKWHIGQDYRGISGDGMYFIRWDDDVTLTFADYSKVYIYVTLTFPKNTADAETGAVDNVWKSYASAVGGATLTNAFYVELYSANVTHVLRAPGEVRLQKGIYAVARTNTATGQDDHLNYVGSSRYYYNNTDSASRVVIYYVTLYNGGSPRLYINPLQDQLPRGFEFRGLINTAAPTKFGTDQVLNVNGNPFTMNDTSITYKDIKVTAAISASSAETDKKNIRFEIAQNGSGKSAVKYDEKRGLCYLEQGEAISFAYVAAIANSASATDDEAKNTIAMLYEDYVGAGVFVSEQGMTYANTLDIYTDQNNGDCQVLSDHEVEENGYGFYKESGDTNTQWLISDVTLTRGTIKPGIQKTTENPWVGYSDIVKWTVRLNNGGGTVISNYTVKDIMSTPYIFAGEVTYKIYDSQNRETAKGTLLEVTGYTLKGGTKKPLNEKVSLTNIKDLKNQIESIWVKVHDYNNGNDGWMEHELPIGSTVSARSKDDKISYNVSFDWRDDSLMIVLQFTNEYISIPEEGNVYLEFGTQNISNIMSSETYTNSAELIPNENQKFEHHDIQLASKSVYDETDTDKLIGVSSAAYVTVSGNAVTSSYKTITEHDNPSNTASSKDANNTIVITGRKSKFIYTLTVVNGVENSEDSSASSNDAMKKLVILDNLPFKGDTQTQSTKPRGSEFTVGLAPTDADSSKVNFSVTIKKSNSDIQSLDSSQYTVEYNAKTEFNDNDHNGIPYSGDGWFTYEQWIADGRKLEDVKSIRIIIDTMTEQAQGISIPGGAEVSVSFDAVASAETAEEIIPGSYAWNNFGYSYIFDNSNPTQIQSKAMSGEVGLRLAARPWLIKTLEDSAGEAYKAKQDMYFDFLIYPGEQLAETAETREALIEALETANREYLIVKTMVKAGESESEVIKLTPNQDEAGAYDWLWTTGNKYQVVELPTTSDDEVYNDFIRAEWQLNNKPLGNPDTFEFVYTKDVVWVIDCTNQYRYWNLQITKEDEQKDEHGNAVLLDGAVFGLYTNVVPQNPETVKSIEIGEGPDAVTWYLTREATTQDGKILFEGLAEDRYYLVEHKAPDGYMMSDTYYEIHRELNVAVKNYTVYNKTSIHLPETGGIGTLPYILSGWALLLMSCVLIYRKKYRE